MKWIPIEAHTLLVIYIVNFLDILYFSKKIKNMARRGKRDLKLQVSEDNSLPVWV